MRLVLVASLLGCPLLALVQEDVRVLLRGDETRWETAVTGDPARYAPVVIAALRDEDALVRRHAAEALGRIDRADEELDGGDTTKAARRASIVAALATAARDRVPDVRNQAIRSLVAVLRFRGWARHGVMIGGDKPLRPLIQLGEPAIPVLLDVLRTDKDLSTRASALRVVARYRRPEVLDALLRAIDAEEGSIVLYAMRAALRYDDPRVVRTILANIDKGIPDYSSTMGRWALSEGEPPAASELILQLRRNPDARQRSLVAEALGAVRDPRAAGALMEALQDPEEAVRAAAAVSLGSYPQAPSRRVLMSAARSESSAVRAAALEALGKLRDVSAFERVAEGLKDRDLEVRSAAIQALAQIGGKRAAPLLCPLASQRDLRYPLAQALRSLRDARAIPTLTEILDDVDLYVAQEAAMALAELDVREAIPRLVRSLETGEDRGAAEALAIFGKSAIEALFALYPRAKDQARIVDAFGVPSDPRVVDLLIGIVEDPAEGSAKLSAIQALGTAGDPRAIRPLIRALSTEDRYSAGAAAEALGELRATEAVEPLLNALKRPEISDDAAKALALIGDRRALEPTLAYFKDNDRIGGEAWEAIGNLKDPRIFALLVDELDGDQGSAAAKGLGRFGDPAALSALRPFAEAIDPSFAKAVQEAIARLTPKARL